MTNPENEAPTVSAGPFLFQSWARDDNVVLVRNEQYVDGAPYMDGMIYRVVPDAGSRLAQLQSGEVDVSDVQPSQITAVEGYPDVTTYEWNDDGYTYIGLNLANPANPQPGKDENGNLIEQDPHPILGDVRVRQAIAHALDYDSIIQNIYFGKGYRLPANVFPTIEWAFNADLEPYPFDLEKSAALLEEAGWVDGDGDGVREKDGVPLDLRLITNSSNTARMDLGAYVQDQLNNIGFNIDFQGIEFGTMLEQVDAQTTDMFILGWTGLGSDPNDSAILGADQDIPGSGFNAVSLVNAELEDLYVKGNSVPGCAPEERGPIYKQIQEIMHDQLPYIWVTGRVPVVGYNSRWNGIEPQPWSATSTAPIYWNVQDWSLKVAE
jgi:peptide/nickel transport system substrate-binding protein